MTAGPHGPAVTISRSADLPRSGALSVSHPTPAQGTGQAPTPAGAVPPAPRLRAADYGAYALLRAPLALLELPLFVLLPAFYAERLGMELALVGTVLFLARLIDAAADPAIGALLDRRHDPRTYRIWILWALPVLAVGYAALFRPPTGISLPVWLALSSIVTYLAYSVVSIAYQAWGARLGSDTSERVTVTASREAAGLVGVLLSAALLLPERAHWLVALFVATAMLAAVALLRAPNPRPLPPDDLQPTARAEAAAGAWLAGWQEAFARGAFRRLLAIFLCNGIASAIPATLVLFYVGDVLGAPDRAPLFLMAYFLAAAVGMPLWTRLAARLGLRRSWLLGMGLSVAGFIWAFALGPGDTTPFLIVCLVTGLALGADLAIPPAMLATVLSDAPGERAREGTYFGLWNLATKLNLAAAAGVALPLLGLLGYVPGQSSEHTLSLSATYALLPCVLKLAAVGLLSAAKLPASCDRPS